MSRFQGELLFINSHHTVTLNFYFVSLFVYLFKKWPSQFLSHWELAEPVFCIEEPKQKPDSGSLAEKFKFVFQIQVFVALLALVGHFRMSILSNCNRLTKNIRFLAKMVK